jgi:glycine/D-amino acid oxidase-like deaminating enzyme/nitrite reductase/ring-hydroxylating ferredoxin subunit
METSQLDTTPYWSTSSERPTAATLDTDTTTDVVVVGGGITGLSVAYLLAREGKRVVVLERRRCASADTGHTSAHLTMVTDVRLGELVNRFGRSHAQAVWDAGLAAIAKIDEITREHGMDAGFAWVDGYLHSPFSDSAGEQSESLRAEAALAWELGFDAEYVDSVPTMARPGIRVRNQARIHPRKYLAGLVDAIVSYGGRVYEQAEVEQFHDSPRRVKANGHTVTCEDVVIATHNPIVGFGGMAGATLFQTKLALYSTYVVAGRVPRGVVPDALWWDTADPYQYVRVDPQDDHDVVIVGGEDHKTGQQPDTVACYRHLEARLKAIAPGAEVINHWSGQVIETPDGLPYIGQSADHQYAATGFAGNGLTFGTVSALMLADAILGRANPWADLFDPSRKALTRGLWDYVKENADYPYYMIRDRFAGAEARALREVKRGEGCVIQRNGAKVAAYRDESGHVLLRSAICTHMGCTIGWNAAERTWDCPCHGSRFAPDGKVIAGPAEAPLAQAE